MSTTFQVFPCVELIPSFNEILELATSHLNAFLETYGVKKKVTISAGLRSKENKILPIDLASAAWWEKKQYAWFTVPGVVGGTDAYASDLTGFGEGILTGEITGEKAVQFSNSVQRCLRIGRMWWFRRSAGQPGIISVAYGMLAASLAQLTDGFIFSGDNAWVHGLFPARAETFLTWYFRPELTEESDHKEWAIRCIARLREALKSLP